MPEAAGDSYLQNIPFSVLANAYLEALLEADRTRAHRIIMAALDDGLLIRDLYLGVFQPVQQEVGRLWLLNSVTIAEEHFCTAATQTIMSELYPHIISSQRVGRTLLAACVGSELHEIGVRMVADFFEMEGWDTYYLGAGLPHDQILSALEQRKPDLIALSATMTFHIPLVTELISAIRSVSSSATARIMVGGMPFNHTPELWKSVGADLWAADAEKAVQAARELIQNR